MDVKRYDGKKVYLEIIVGGKTRTYSGKIVEVDDSHKDLTWVTLLDKFSHYITFLADEIKFIQEEA